MFLHVYWANVTACQLTYYAKAHKLKMSTIQPFFRGFKEKRIENLKQRLR